MNYNDREIELRRLAVLLRSGAVDMKHATGYKYEKLFALLDNLDAAIGLPPPLHCPHCNGTGKSTETFDRLCQHCTASHCVTCDKRDDLIKVMTFLMCRACEQIERWES